jgi:hypothetical protein
LVLVPAAYVSASFVDPPPFEPDWVTTPDPLGEILLDVDLMTRAEAEAASGLTLDPLVTIVYGYTILVQDLSTDLVFSFGIVDITTVPTDGIVAGSGPGVPVVGNYGPGVVPFFTDLTAPDAGGSRNVRWDLILTSLDTQSTTMFIASNRAGDPESTFGFFSGAAVAFIPGPSILGEVVQGTNEIPEPGTLMLLGSGLLLAGIGRRKARIKIK